MIGRPYTLLKKPLHLAIELEEKAICDIATMKEILRRESIDFAEKDDALAIWVFEKTVYLKDGDCMSAVMWQVIDELVGW